MCAIGMVKPRLGGRQGETPPTARPLSTARAWYPLPMQPAIKRTPKQSTGEDTEARAPLADHDALLRAIAEDARREPERFLKDSIVPKGGE